MQEIESFIQGRTWGYKDRYLVVEVQVDSSMFKRGEQVKVTVDKL